MNLIQQAIQLLSQPEPDATGALAALRQVSGFAQDMAHLVTEATRLRDSIEPSLALGVDAYEFPLINSEEPVRFSASIFFRQPGGEDLTYAARSIAAHGVEATIKELQDSVDISSLGVPA
ncbi:hypothetical protein D9M69_502190 [compost metagenome]